MHVGGYYSNGKYALLSFHSPKYLGAAADIPPYHICARSMSTAMRSIHPTTIFHGIENIFQIWTQNQSGCHENPWRVQHGYLRSQIHYTYAIPLVDVNIWLFKYVSKRIVTVFLCSFDQFAHFLLQLLALFTCFSEDLKAPKVLQASIVALLQWRHSALKNLQLSVTLNSTSFDQSTGYLSISKVSDALKQ